MAANIIRGADPAFHRPYGFRRDQETLGHFAEPMCNSRLYKVHVVKNGVRSTTTLRAGELSEATFRARSIFNRADSITVEEAQPTELERIREDQFRRAAAITEARDAESDPLRAARGIAIAVLGGLVIWGVVALAWWLS